MTKLVRPRRFHRLLIASALVFSAIGTIWLFGIRIEPSALLLRTYTDKFASATAIETDHYAPQTSVSRKANQNYGAGGVETSFDVYRPTSAGKKKLPTVFWVHGGGWIGGSKDFVAPFLRKMASAGYTVVGLNYPLAPTHQYPSVIAALNDAFDYVIDRSAAYGVDTSNIVLAGNEVGANMVSQIAVLTTNSTYAAEAGLESGLSKIQLKGVILNGGIYDVAATQSLTGLARWRTNTQLWATTGSRDWAQIAAGEQISTIDGISRSFPPTWMAAGDMDPLTAQQSVPFATRLAASGVAVTTIFPDQGANLPADFQFMLALPAAKRAFGSMLDFIAQVTSSTAS